MGEALSSFQTDLRRARRRGDLRPATQIAEHYEIELELAGRLRDAPQSQRAALYPVVYDELLHRVPHHPMLKATSELSAVARRRREVEQRMRFLRPLLSPETVFIEVGAGDCALALRAASLAKQVYAIDVSERITRNVVPPSNFKLILSDGVSIPLPAGSVDLAFSDQLMEHLHPRDAEEQLRNIARCLAPGGRYVCITPNRLYGPTDVSGYFGEVASGFHLKEYSARDIRDLFASAGFTRLQFCAGARGAFLRLPMPLLTGAEAVLEGLPRPLTRRIAETAPMRALLGLRVIATKGVMGKRILILVENLPSPFDRRVWQEANALRDAGHTVSIICPTGRGCEKRFEHIDGIDIHRYALPVEGEGALAYLAEYSAALWHSLRLAWTVFFGRGFDVIQACNPPDLLFLVALPFKLLGRKFVFDHHDLCPELYEAKFGRRGLLWRVMRAAEWLTFRAADVSIATNESYRRVAIGRGGMNPERVFVVRSGPSLERLKVVPPVPALRRGRKYLVGYVGVMGRQEGIDYLLRAVRHIVHDLGRTDIQFGLVGGGTSLEAMKALAQELGVAEYVTFTGRVPDAEMLAMLNTADVCVNPDVANDMNDKSTMNKIMEYMALGKPIVQFDLAEGRFSARDASLYAARNDAWDFADRIVELIDDPARRAEMGAYGRRRVEQELEWRYEVPKLLAAYGALWPQEAKATNAAPDMREQPGR